MNEDGPIKAQPSRFRIGRVVWTAMWLFLLLLFLGATGMVTLVELPFRLVFGCLIHLLNLSPSLLPQWQSLLLPLACLAISLPLAHRLIVWLAAFNGKAAWRLPHSIAALSLLLGGSAAAIAMSGITHQMAWLADVPWWNDRSRRDSTGAMMKIRNLQMVIAEFRSEHGRYPESLGELADRIANFERETMIPSGLAGLPEPFLYLKPEAGALNDPPVPVLVSPFLKHGQIAVGFTDHSIRVLRVEQFESILKKSPEL